MNSKDKHKPLQQQGQGLFAQDAKPGCPYMRAIRLVALRLAYGHIPGHH
jgi:hypothetical protein